MDKFMFVQAMLKFSDSYPFLLKTNYRAMSVYIWLVFVCYKPTNYHPYLYHNTLIA